MDSAPPHNRRHAYLRSSTGGQHPHIHAISDTDFMGQKSLTVRGRNAGVSWRDEEAVEENIFQCCVMGRLERVRYLVEVRQVQVNQRDQWDSTPLYYSCLAGHENLVQYLLEQGARCEENTFDGERCFHAALTNSIRNTLREHKAISRAHDPFSDFLRNSFFYHADDLSLRSDERPPHSDIHFVVHGKHAWAHRVVLAARSPYFRHMFRTRWKGKRKIVLAHPHLDADAFKAVIHFLYTERLQVPRTILHEAEAMAKQFELWDLDGVLLREIKKENAGVALRERVIIELTDIYRSTHKQRTGPTPLQSDLGKIAMRSIRNAYSVPSETVEENEEDMFEDIIFKVEGRRFKCHKFFFCGRSEYFKALIMGNFKEGEGYTADCEDLCGDQDEDETDLRELRELELNDVSAEAFAHIVDFIYTDSLSHVTTFMSHLRHELKRSSNHVDVENELSEEWHVTYEVLQLSDMYMLPVLRNFCAVILSQTINMDNLFELLDLAKLMSLDQLNDSLVQFIALNVEELLELRKEELADLVRESAFTIANRQATDTIPIIDDIRTALDQLYPAHMDGEEKDEVVEEEEAPQEMVEKNDYQVALESIEAAKNHKLDLLDQLIEELGLSG